MQLRRHGLQLLVLLVTLTATESWSATEIPCPPLTSDIAFSSPAPPQPLTHLNPSPVLSSLVSPSLQDDAACIGKRSLSALVTNKNTAIILGFKDPEEVSKPDSVTIGEPFELYQVDLLDLRRFNPANDKVKDLIKLNKGLRIYPLLTKRPEDGPGAKTRSALVVSKRGDKWIPTNWGLAQLAQAMAEYRGREGFTSGIIVWIPALNLHFLGTNPNENLNNEDLFLIPLAHRLAYGIIKGEKISAKTVFTFYAREANSLDESNPG